MEHTKKYFSISNVFGESFNLWTNNFIQYSLPFLVIVFPISLFLKYLTGIGVIGESLSILTSIFESGITSLVSFYIIALALKDYLGIKKSFNEVIDIILKIFFPLIFLQLVITLGILAGMLLIVPGIFFALAWSLASIVMIDEDKKILESMKRSRELTKGAKGEIFLIGLVYSLFSFLLLGVFSLISKYLMGGVGSSFLQFIASSSTSLSIENTLYTFLSYLITPLYSIFFVVIYYNLKKDKEGFALEELAGSFLDNSTNEE